MSYPIPDLAYRLLEENPELSGAELARRTGIAGRSARRYVRKFREGEAIPKNGHQPPVVDSRIICRAPVLLRPAVYDIEVTDFNTNGYGGIMIMCCILPLDSDEVTTIGIDFSDAHDDRRVLAEIREELAKYDILIGHNIAGFDANWINSKLMFYGMPPLRTHLYFDTYQIAKSMAIKTSKSLGNLMDYFAIPAEKTSIYQTSWMNILSPKREVFEDAYDHIQYHCEQDVIGTRKLFDVLYPYSLALGTANPLKVSKARVMQW